VRDGGGKGSFSGFDYGKLCIVGPNSIAKGANAGI
jgi:hypothetical protein